MIIVATSHVHNFVNFDTEGLNFSHAAQSRTLNKNLQLE